MSSTVSIDVVVLDDLDEAKAFQQAYVLASYLSTPGRLVTVSDQFIQMEVRD